LRSDPVVYEVDVFHIFLEIWGKVKGGSLHEVNENWDLLHAVIFAVNSKEYF
jgi:hypothetical protein